MNLKFLVLIAFQIDQILGQICLDTLIYGYYQWTDINYQNCNYYANNLEECK